MLGLSTTERSDNDPMTDRFMGKYLQLASVYHVTVQLGMQLEVRASLRRSCWSMDLTEPIFY